MSDLVVVDRTKELPADLSKLTRDTDRWLYLDVKPRGTFFPKDDRRTSTPRGYPQGDSTRTGLRPPWKSPVQAVRQSPAEWAKVADARRAAKEAAAASLAQTAGSLPRLSEPAAASS